MPIDINLSYTVAGAAAAPAISGVPTISGNASVGSVLSAAPASLSQGTPVPTRTWAWERRGTPIPGATSDTYTLVAADQGETVTVVQTETNSSGSDSAESAATATVVTAPSGIGFVYSIGEETPATARSLPMPGTSDRTVGPFTVSSGFATWSSLSGLGGNSYSVGTHTVKVTAGVATVAHYLDAAPNKAITWAKPVDIDIDALGRSLPIPDPSTLIDVRLNPPAGVNVSAAAETVTITPSFTGWFEGYSCKGYTIQVAQGVQNLSGIRNCHFEFEAADKGKFGGRSWLAIQGNNNPAHLPMLEKTRFVMPFDFGYPGIVLGPSGNPKGQFSYAKHVFCRNYSGDFYKPHGFATETTFEECVLGCGGSTNGRFRGNWSSGSTYSIGEYVKNPGVGGVFSSRTNGNIGNAPPGNKNGSNSNWQGFDPHSDTMQTATLQANLNVINTVIAQRPIDVDGTGQYFSGTGIVNVFRWNTPSQNSTISNGTLKVSGGILLRVPGTNPAIDITGGGWPSGAAGAEFEDVIIEANATPNPWADFFGAYFSGNNSKVYRVNGCRDARSGIPITQVGP